MEIYFKGFVVKFVILLAFTLSSFTFAQANQREQDARAISDLVEAAKLLAGTNLECQDSTDCVVLEVGSRACGGPAGHLISSKKNQNLPELEYLGQQSSLKEAEFNLKYRVLSICSVKIPPQVGCIRAQCKTLNSGEGL